ncbi:unnamed protein product [Bathycoccus prasinos]
MSSSHKPPKWLPLESNPSVLNDFSYALGLSTAYAWSDIFGFDDELLAMVPPNCRAVVLLFPITDKSERFQKEEQTDIENGKRANEVSSNVYYMKQTVGNACGTIGVFHAIMNNREDVLTNQNEDEEENKNYFRRFFEKTKDMTPDERAKFVELDTDLESYHATAVNAGDTEVPSLDAKIDLHFIALVERDGRLYELDGRKQSAIDHGEIERGDLLKQSVERVIKGFMERADGSIHFGACALAENSELF